MPEFIHAAKYKRGSLFDGIRHVPSGKDVDCDDFAYTLLSILEGGQIGAIKALASGRAELWRVRSPLNGKIARHVALWHCDYGWIDSTVRWWRQGVYPHTKVRKMRLVTVVPLVLWGKMPVKVAVMTWGVYEWAPLALAIARGWW